MDNTYGAYAAGVPTEFASCGGQRFVSAQSCVATCATSYSPVDTGGLFQQIRIGYAEDYRTGPWEASESPCSSSALA